MPCASPQSPTPPVGCGARGEGTDRLLQPQTSDVEIISENLSCSQRWSCNSEDGQRRGSKTGEGRTLDRGEVVGRGRRGLPMPSSCSQECFCAAAVGTLPTVPADTVEKLRLCRPPNPWVIPLRSYVSLWVTSLNLPGPRFLQLQNGMNKNLCPPGCLQIQSNNM